MTLCKPPLGQQDNNYYIQWANLILKMYPSLKNRLFKDKVLNFNNDSSNSRFPLFSSSKDEEPAVAQLTN